MFKILLKIQKQYLSLQCMAQPHGERNHASFGLTEKPSDLMRHLGSLQWGELRMGNTIIEGSRILYSASFSSDGLKVVEESENINSLPGIDIMMIIIMSVS